MTKADRNHKIVEHLRDRFKERHGIELTRDRRMMLLRQIHSGVAKELHKVSFDKSLYRVYIYSNKYMHNLPYTVIYCKSIDQILTVLPRPDSEEYEAFLQKNRLDREMVERRELTAAEKTAIDVERARRRMAEHEQNKRVEEGKRRLKEWKNSQKYFLPKRVDNAIRI